MDALPDRQALPVTDYSEHLVLARKALATAEAQAALHKWKEARESLDQVRFCIKGAEWSIQDIERKS